MSPRFRDVCCHVAPIGVIEGEQGDKQGKERNDRIIAVEQDAHSWEDIKTITDLSKQFCRELEEFFVNYHRLTGKEYRVLGLKGPNQARKLVKIRKAMTQLLVRFLIGGLVVSVFAVVGDLLKPKSFAGLFGAAPSVALATLGLTVAREGPFYAATQAHSMMAGAIAFFAYASFVSWCMMRYKTKAFLVTLCAIPMWLGVALGLWRVWLT